MPTINNDRENGTVEIQIVAGVEGPSVSITRPDGCGMRVAGPKPWGGGVIRQRFTTRVADLREALAFVERKQQPRHSKEKING